MHTGPQKHTDRHKHTDPHKHTVSHKHTDTQAQRPRQGHTLLETGRPTEADSGCLTSTLVGGGGWAPGAPEQLRETPAQPGPVAAGPELQPRNSAPQLCTGSHIQKRPPHPVSGLRLSDCQHTSSTGQAGHTPGPGQKGTSTPHAHCHPNAEATGQQPPGPHPACWCGPAGPAALSPLRP